MKKKKIFWSFFGKEIIFNLNWFEYLIFRRVFSKRKYEVRFNSGIVKGLKLDLIVYDDVGFDKINWKETYKLNQESEKLGGKWNK